MNGVNKIGLDYEKMNENGERWDNPEDIINYVASGLKFLEKHKNKKDLETIDKRNRWIYFMNRAMECLSVIE